jgi:hypothetical protein
MGDWKFSLTHFLSIVGFVVTIAIAYFGFRTFERWKREKIEEKRIDIAIEALALAYDTQEGFGAIRSAMSSGDEWADMPRRPGEADDAWGSGGHFTRSSSASKATTIFLRSWQSCGRGLWRCSAPQQRTILSWSVKRARS